MIGELDKDGDGEINYRYVIKSAGRYRAQEPIM